LSSRASVAPGTTNVTVKVTDATRSYKTVTFTISARDACWFAYTSLESSGPRLQLLDPFGTLAPQTLEHNQGVYDFQFSPNGQFLAYRYGRDETHPTGQRLALITLSSPLREQSIPVEEDAITAYAWSPDSKSIALAFSKNTATFLTAVRIAAADSNTAPLALPPKLAFVESDLFWIGNSVVAFHAERLADLGNPGEWLPNPYKQRTPFYARLGATGFDAPEPIVDYGYDPGVYLQPTNSGFFMITDADPFTFFNGLIPNVAFPSPLAFTQLISASGQYSAALNDGQLEIYSATDGEGAPPVAVSNDGEKCPMLLAWAKDRERIACVADVPNPRAGGIHGEIRIFDLDAANHQLTMSTLQGFCTDDTDSAVSAGSCATLENRYSYSTAHASGYARGLSPSGRWLAFTAASTDNIDHYLYWADLNDPSLTLKRKAYLHTTHAVSFSPIELSFSPNEEYLLLRNGNRLSQQDLSAGPAIGPARDPQLLTTALASGEKCSEGFPSAPDRWCGNIGRSAIVRWAPDSSAVAFRTADAVTAVDVTNFPIQKLYSLPAPNCELQCAGQFAFQPVPKP
jgi:Tol biopolymer transport system component